MRHAADLAVGFDDSNGTAQHVYQQAPRDQLQHEGAGVLAGVFIPNLENPRFRSFS